MSDAVHNSSPRLAARAAGAPALRDAPTTITVGGARAGARLRGRAPWLAGAGAAAFALAFSLAPRERQAEVIEAVAPARASAPGPEAGASRPLAAPAREPITQAAAADPFLAATFVPPPAPPPAPVKVAAPPPPPAPSAPPLPYTFVGMLEKGAGRPAAFIARGDTLLVVTAGEVIDGSYRVESLDPRAVVLTYLPLGQTQYLNLSGASQ